MDLQLNLEEEEVDYLTEIGFVETLTDSLEQALKYVVRDRSVDPLLSMLQVMSQCGGEETKILVRGYPVTCIDSVSVGVGPVVGEVTHNMAIIMLEVQDHCKHSVEVTCHLYKKGSNIEDFCQTIDMPFQTPRVFLFQEPDFPLEPDTEYVAVFSGLRKEDSSKTFALFKTKPEPDQMKTFKILALSCDRPDRMMLGQKNPWYELARKTYYADVMLHLGDQVYNKGEDNDNTEQLFGLEYDGLSEAKKYKMKKRARALLRKKYRETWNKKMTHESLQRGCHHMIWSDNDVANDFTTMKDQNGEQAYPPAFLQCGIEVYRRYQRVLWDPSILECKDVCMPADDEYFQEFHSHIYGPIGIFMVDMRGNRITGDGVQKSENHLIGDEQWAAIEEFFQTEGLQV